MTTFAQRLTELREKAGKKRQEVADDLGISRASLEYYEKGKRKPDTDILFRIAKYFNTSADYLIGLSDVPTTDKDLKFVCEYTGLSEKAVEELCNNRKLHIQGFWNFVSGKFDILNKLIESNTVFEICLYIDAHYEAAKEVNETVKSVVEEYKKTGYLDSYFEKGNDKITEKQEKLDLCLFRLQNLVTDFAKEFSSDLFIEIYKKKCEFEDLLKGGADNGKHN